SLPDTSSAPFPTPLKTTVFSQGPGGRFEASSRKATPKGLPSSPAQHRVKELCLHAGPLHVRDTHQRIRASRLKTGNAQVKARILYSSGTAPTGCPVQKPGVP